MNWQIRITKKALKQTKKIPKKDYQQLLTILENFSNDPDFVIFWG